MAAFTVNNHVFVNPGYEEEFEARFKARAGEIDKQPGAVAMRVLRPLGNQAPSVVETERESQDAFRAWVGNDGFKRVHAHFHARRSNPRERWAGVVRSGGKFQRLAIALLLAFAASFLMARKFRVTLDTTLRFPCVDVGLANQSRIAGPRQGH